MKYKWLWSLLVVAMITICLFIFLPLNENQSTPSSLPNENNLKKMILDTGEVNVNTIFEQIALDEKHVFIPHLSSDNQYGYSLLEWVDNKWEVTYVTSSGEPLLWKINGGSQSDSYFLWNLETKYNIDYLTFYMIKHRNFRSGWGGEFYEPAIQIENNVSLGAKPYGIYKVSDEWQRIWKATQIKVEEQEEDLFSFNNEEALHYGVKGYDKENNYVDPYNYYENISSFNSGAKTEHVSILDEWDGGIEAILIGGMSALNSLLISAMIKTGNLETILGAAATPEEITSIKKQFEEANVWLFATGGLERIFAIALHLALSILVLYAIRKNKFTYVLYAILIHAAINFLPALYQAGTLTNLLVIEIFLGFIAILSIVFIVKMKPKFER